MNSRCSPTFPPQTRCSSSHFLPLFKASLFCYSSFADSCFYQVCRYAAVHLLINQLAIMSVIVEDQSPPPEDYVLVEDKEPPTQNTDDANEGAGPRKKAKKWSDD